MYPPFRTQQNRNLLIDPLRRISRMDNIDAYIAAQIESAPPLTDLQTAKLRTLLAVRPTAVKLRQRSTGTATAVPLEGLARPASDS